MEMATTASAEIPAPGFDIFELIGEEVLYELSTDELAELVRLCAEAERLHMQLANPERYLIDRYDVRTQLSSDMYRNTTRIDELISGYPQTGSAASILAHLCRE